MPAPRKMGRDKEMMAVTYNLKEDRCLEKSMQTLNLERAYSMKLLNLDHRIIRVNYKRLKEKVSRIKSHLSANEISDLKQLEAEGKLKPTHSVVNIGSAIKIASAARRLKLQTPQSRMSTFIQTPFPNGGDEQMTTPRSNTCNNLKRSNSVTGVFIDAPEPRNDKRRNSTDNGVTFRPQSAVTSSENHNQNQNGGNKIRPATSAYGNNNAKLFSPRSYFQTPKVNGPIPSHSPYSSHSVAEKESRIQSGVVQSPSRAPRSAFMSDDIDSNLGDDLYEERRQDLIFEEEANFKMIGKKKDNFLDKIDAYLKENPVPDWSNPSGTINFDDTPDDDEIEETSSRIGSAGSRSRLLPGRLEISRTFSNEERYRRKMMELWKDLNKCRYLRLPEERLDLSGVNTLAQDQLKMLRTLKETPLR